MISDLKETVKGLYTHTPTHALLEVPMTTYQLVLVRHGQSTWNLENKFTGWVDVDLTPKGEAEAKAAGQKLKGMKFDKAYTSELKRAQRTLQIILEEIGQTKLPIEK